MKERFIFHTLLLFFTILVSENFFILFFVIPISIICILAACRSNNSNLDIIDIFWILYQLSFVLVPAANFQQHNGDTFYQMGVIINYSRGSLYYSSEIFLTFFLVIFLVAIINLMILPKDSKLNRSKFEYSLNVNVFLLVFLIYVFFFMDVHFKGGFDNLLAARYDRDQDSISTFSILFTSIFFVTTWLAILKVRIINNFKGWLLIPIILLPLVISVNIFNAARFFIIQAWLPIVFILFPWLRTFKVFSILLVLGIMVIMPILSLTTRHGKNAELNELNLSPIAFLEFLDQSQVFLELIQMVQKNGYEWGLSILSVLGFFVPRFIWEEKPIVVGLEVGNELFDRGYVGTSNLSGPIFLDFYYDFGILGVILGSIIVAKLFSVFIKNASQIDRVPLFEYIILASLPILFRGSVGAVVGIVFFSLIFYYVYLVIFANKKIKN